LYLAEGRQGNAKSYNNLMTTVRTATRILLVILLTGLLVLLAILTSLVSIVGSEDRIQSSIDSSGLYKEGAGRVIDTIGEVEINGVTIPLDEPAIEQAAEQAFNESTIKRSSSEIVGGIYGWLRGETDQPEFAVEIEDEKRQFADGVADYAEQRYTDLPECTSFGQISLPFNPLEAECRPPFAVDTSLIRERAITEFMNSEEFFRDGTIKPDDILGDGFGQTAGTKDLPNAYQWLQRAPRIIGVITAVVFAILLFGHRDKRRALRAIRTSLGAAGILVLVVALAGWLITSSFNTGGAADAYHAIFASIAKSLYGEWNKFMLLFGGGYILLAIILWIGMRFGPKPTVSDLPKAPLSN
jgi:hypothetical protein